MTREEVMSYIIPAIERTWNDKICKQIKEVLNEQPCEDAISRQAAIEIIQGWLDHDMGYSFEGKNIMRCAIVELENLPSVSTEKVGTDHWEKLWDKLYNWLNDTRLNVAPDETVKDEIERHERLAQADMLDEVMECMLDLESRREEGETD